MRYRAAIPTIRLPGAGEQPDQGLPGEQPGADNELPRPPFNPEVDNELPEGEIPPEIDNSLPGYSGGRPGNTLPGEGGDTMPIGGTGKGRDPNLDPNANPDLGRKSEAAKPKRQY